MPGLGGWRGLSGLGGQRWSGWTEKVWVICVQEKANCPSPLNLNLTHYLTLPLAAGKNDEKDTFSTRGKILFLAHFYPKSCHSKTDKDLCMKPSANSREIFKRSWVQVSKDSTLYVQDPL